MATARSSDRAFLGAAALLFAASTAVTAAWCSSMATMDGMPMPGGWTMSMAWMRMPGQSWPGAAASFLGMWTVMMVAMMLPSLVPMLVSYRESLARSGEPRRNSFTLLVGSGYFFVWTLLGVAAFPIGLAVAAAEMQHPALARAVPSLTGLVVLIAGALQFTRWKQHQLACCRPEPACRHALATDLVVAWREGLRLGLHCASCCAGPTAALLALGVMDLRAMVLVTLAITAERLFPDGRRAAHGVGLGALAMGAALIVQATTGA